MLGLWLRQMVTARTASLLQSNRIQDIVLLRSVLLTKGQEKDAGFLQRVITDSHRLNATERFAASFAKMNQRLADTTTHVFSRVLMPVEQRLLICELEQVIDEVKTFRALTLS